MNTPLSHPITAMTQQAFEGGDWQHCDDSRVYVSHHHLSLMCPRQAVRPGIQRQTEERHGESAGSKSVVLALRAERAIITPQSQISRNLPGPVLDNALLKNAYSD